MKELNSYTLIRQRRKTLALIINPDATITIKAPYFTPRFFINNFIKEKQDWIISKLKQIQARPKLKKKEFINGEEFLYLGKSYPLEIVTSETITLTEKLSVPFNTTRIMHKKLLHWYKARSLEILTQRVGVYAALMKVQFKEISLSNAQRQWGACTYQNNLSFSWRLIMAPLSVMDYVVVHELAHIKEKNHSTKFWSLVASYCPEYKLHKNWLKAHAHEMEF